MASKSDWFFFLVGKVVTAAQVIIYKKNIMEFIRSTHSRFSSTIREGERPPPPYLLLGAFLSTYFVVVVESFTRDARPQSVRRTGAHKLRGE